MKIFWASLTAELAPHPLIVLENMTIESPHLFRVRAWSLSLMGARHGRGMVLMLLSECKMRVALLIHELEPGTLPASMPTDAVPTENAA